MWSVGDDVYIKTDEGNRIYNPEFDSSNVEIFKALAKNPNPSDVESNQLNDYLTNTMMKDIPKSLITDIIAQGNTDTIAALGNVTSEIGRSGDGTSSGDRSKFTDVNKGDYITINGQIYEVTGSIGSLNYRSKGRKDGDVKRVSKRHYAQYVVVTGPDGKEYELQSTPSYDQGHISSADARDSNTLPTLYL
jgi:hypothetical protein